MADLHKVRVRAFIDEPEIGALEANEPVKSLGMLCRVDMAGKDRDYSKQWYRTDTKRGELLAR